MNPRDLRPLDREPVSIRPPFDVREPWPMPPPHRLVGPDTEFDAWRARLIADRVAALTGPLADMPLGSYDRRTVRWLAGWDVPTVGGVASLLYRAREAAPLTHGES